MVYIHLLNPDRLTRIKSAPLALHSGTVWVDGSSLCFGDDRWSCINKRRTACFNRPIVQSSLESFNLFCFLYGSLLHLCGQHRVDCLRPLKLLYLLGVDVDIVIVLFNVDTDVVLYRSTSMPISSCTVQRRCQCRLVLFIVAVDWFLVMSAISQLCSSPSHRPLRIRRPCTSLTRPANTASYSKIPPWLPLPRDSRNRPVLSALQPVDGVHESHGSVIHVAMFRRLSRPSCRHTCHIRSRPLSFLLS
jgi:hypothetical protein